MPPLQTIDLKRMPYDQAFDIQMALVEKVKAAEDDLGYLLLVEHDPPVITLGRSAEEKNILLDPKQLKQQGIELRHISRGGDVTYHGPGQVVGYLIVRLDLRGRDVHKFLRNIEEIIIRTLADFDIEGRRIPGLTGVRVGDEKIAATGVAVTRWITYHGFALNIAPNLEHFGLIVPCGITDKGVTSLEKVTGQTISLDTIKSHLAQHAAGVMGFQGYEWQELTDTKT